MATKADFTADEWQTLANAPLMTSLIVTAASLSGPIGVMRELFASARSIAEADRAADTNPLLKELIADMKARQVTPEKMQAHSAEELRSLALGEARKIAALLDQKAAADAEPIKRWLYANAQSVAHAVKEGGFLGFGGVEVSEQEQAALKELAGVLGIPA